MLALTHDFGRFHPFSVGLYDIGLVLGSHTAGIDSKGDLRVKIEHVLWRYGRKQSTNLDNNSN